MGNIFKTAKTTTKSNLAPEQEALLGRLSDYISGQIGTTPQGFGQLSQSLLAANTQQAQATAERLFSEALLGPALRNFDTQVAPRIGEQFASIGGTLSSRRGSTIAQALTDTYTNATGQLAALLPQIQAFPLQQTLGQIQGLAGLQGIQYAPFQQGLQFALPGTRSVAQQAAGPGWGLLDTALGAGAFLLGGGGGKK